MMSWGKQEMLRHIGQPELIDARAEDMLAKSILECDRRGFGMTQVSIRELAAQIIITH